MKKIKNTLLIALAMSMTLALSACGGGAATETGADNVVNVGVAIYQFDDNFMTLYRKELQRIFAEDLGDISNKEFRVTVEDGKNDQAEQTNQIDNFIAEEYDVLIVNLVQTSAGQTVLDKCKEANIPVIFINREPGEDVLASWEKAAYVGADARQSGTYQGEIIVETPNKGDINGDGVINYVTVQGDPENVDAQYRTEFSVKALVDAGLTVNELALERGDWAQEKGEEIVSNFLTQFGDDLEVIFCNNDAMALGARQAIESNGRVVNKDIYLVGVDALEEAVELVKADQMTGTVFNDHMNQSAQAVNVVLDVLDGKDLDDLYAVNYIKITPSNAETYLSDAKEQQQLLLK